MRILIIADPLAHFKIYKDTTFAMMEEADARGHELYCCELNELSVSDGQVLVMAHRTYMTDEGGTWYKQDPAVLAPVTSFDGILMRKDPPFNLEYLYATQLLTLAEQQGAHVYNSGQAMRDLNEKLAILQFDQFTAPTLVCRDSKRLRQFVHDEGDVILKPLDSMGGESIFRVAPHDANLSVILEIITRRDQRTVMAQRYIPEISKGDKRILLIAGKPVDYCLARVPLPGETRGNLAAGGQGEARPLSARDREIAEGVGQTLWERGILLAGLDVIGDYLTEVNVTSPTCFREIMTQTELPVAGQFIDALEKACAV